MTLLDQIPGYREAVAREVAARAQAFTDAPEMVCGVELLPFTPRHLLVCEAMGSPLVRGGVVGWRDVALFLWACSPDYRAAVRIRSAVEPWSRWVAGRLFRRIQMRFYRGLRGLNFGEAEAGCRAYLDGALADGPGYTQTEWTPSYYSPVAATVVCMAERFGWKEADILDAPLRRLWQYKRALRAQDDPDALFFNPSDRVRSAWLRERSATN